MKNTGTRDGTKSGFPRTMFVIALLITLGGALAALQTSMPVREAFGLEPIIEGLPPRTLWTRDLPAGRLDAGPAWSPSHANVRYESTTVRRLGSGTQRARLNEPSVHPVLSAMATSQPVVSAERTVAAAEVVEPSSSFTE